MKEFFKQKLALTDQGASDIIKSSVACFITFLLNMLPAMLLMLLLDQLLLSNIRNSYIYYGISFAILVFMYIFTNIEYNSLYNATYRESENLRIDIARNLSELPLSYFSKHDLSDLAQTIMSDVAGLEHALSHAISKAIGFVGFFIVISILLLSGNFKLGLCIILPLIAYFAALLLSKKINVKNNKKYYDKLRENAERFQESIELQQEIKSFGMGDEVKKDMYRNVEDGEQIHIRSELLMAVINAFSSLILYLQHIFIIIIGSEMLLRGEINILYFVGYLLAAFKIKDGVEGIAMNVMEIFHIDAMINRINEIRNTKRQEGEDIELLSYDIELKNVSFSYDGDTQVLRNVSFVAKQNEVTALVGKSGCGKTSILRLVSRLFDYESGTIKISGQDIKNISTKSLFDKVSIVFQDVSLFNTSILENIRIGNLNATDEEVKNAARLANCEEFIEKLSEGYQTIIGENGAKLSGGERQRLSIARAFLKNAPIIILDEIAASLDIDNEKKIQDSLNKLTVNKTVLIITHRLKSIENVDKIVVIDEGRVESIGKHQELLANSKIYAELVQKNNLAESFAY